MIKKAAVLAFALIFASTTSIFAQELQVTPAPAAQSSNTVAASGTEPVPVPVLTVSAAPAQAPQTAQNAQQAQPAQRPATPAPQKKSFWKSHWPWAIVAVAVVAVIWGASDASGSGDE